MSDRREALEEALAVIKIAVTVDEKKTLTEELGVFIDWLQPMLDLPGREAEPVINGFNAKNVLREDLAQSQSQDALQEAAPDFADQYYRVPAIID